MLVGTRIKYIHSLPLSGQLSTEWYSINIEVICNKILLYFFLFLIEFVLKILLKEQHLYGSCYSSPLNNFGIGKIVLKNMTAIILF